MVHVQAESEDRQDQCVCVDCVDQNSIQRNVKGQKSSKLLKDARTVPDERGRRGSWFVAFSAYCLQEYIGDDKGILHDSVKKCIAQCCVQLKKRMLAAQAMRDRVERRKAMSKYIPDVARSFMKLLNTMAQVDAEEEDGAEGHGAIMVAPAAKRQKREHEAHAQLMQKLNIKPQEQESVERKEGCVRLWHCCLLEGILG
jgi:hypothetical protein